MPLDTRQLRLFLAVADELHFRRAARHVGLTQPALSHQIAQLEAHLGVRLFERHPRQVTLTEAGRLLQDGGRRLVADLDRLEESTRRAGGQARRLVLGFVEYANMPILPALLRKLRDAHPDLEIETRELYTTEVLAALNERTIDAGFAYGPFARPSLVTHPVLEGRWMAVLPREHPLASRPDVPLDRLAGEPLVMFARHINPPLHDQLLEQCRASGFEPRLVYKLTQASLGPDLVAAGVGAWLVVSYTLRSLPETVVAVPLSGFDSTVRIHAIWRADAGSPPLETFRKALPRRPLVRLGPGAVPG